MRVLVRIYQPQRDKLNVNKKTLEEGMELLGVTEEDIKQRVPWSNMEDVYFKGTKNYIRIIND